MMAVLTPATKRTSTWLSLLSTALIWTRSACSTDARRGPVDQAREQFDAVRTSEIGTVGQVGIRARTPDGEAGRRVSLTWFDAAGDGRYLLESSAGAALTPCDSVTLTRALADQLAREPTPGGAVTPSR